MFLLFLMIIYDVSNIFDGVVPHFYHIMFCYPIFQYVWWLYTVFIIFLMLIYLYLYIYIMYINKYIYIFPYVWWLCHMFPIFLGCTTLSGIFDHNSSHMFEFFPIFLMVLRCCSLYFRWLYPYVWWLYHMVVPDGRKPSKSSASAAASARSQVGFENPGCWWEKNIGTHGTNLENSWKRWKKWEDPRSKWRFWSEHHLWFRDFPSPHLIAGA